jgi:hypothetical protein
MPDSGSLGPWCTFHCRLENYLNNNGIKNWGLKKDVKLCYAYAECPKCRFTEIMLTYVFTTPVTVTARSKV